MPTVVEGRVLTTEPPGRSQYSAILIFFLYSFKIYLCVYGCAGSLLPKGHLHLWWTERRWRAGYSLVSVRKRLIVVASPVAEHRLQSAGPVVAPQHVRSSRTRYWTCAPCTSRWTPNHWTIREVPDTVPYLVCIPTRLTEFLPIILFNWKRKDDLAIYLLGRSFYAGTHHWLGISQ